MIWKSYRSTVLLVNALSHGHYILSEGVDDKFCLFGYIFCPLGGSLCLDHAFHFMKT